MPRKKIEDYLLDLSHPIGADKARFFMQFGFRREEWSRLVDALFRHAQENPVADSISDPSGITYLVEGRIITPSGRHPRVRTVWLIETIETIETGELAPRFITAYPLAL